MLHPNLSYAAPKSELCCTLFWATLRPSELRSTLIWVTLHPIWATLYPYPTYAAPLPEPCFPLIWATLHPDLSHAPPSPEPRFPLIWASLHPDLSHAAPLPEPRFPLIWAALHPFLSQYETLAELHCILLWATLHHYLSYAAHYLIYSAPWHKTDAIYTASVQKFKFRMKKKMNKKVHICVSHGMPHKRWHMEEPWLHILYNIRAQPKVFSAMAQWLTF